MSIEQSLSPINANARRHTAFSRVAAAALLAFAPVATVSFLGVGPLGRSVLIVGAAVCVCVIGAANGRAFFKWARPFPEILLLASWAASAVGWGRILPSLDPKTAILFVFIAPVLAAAALLWAGIKVVHAPALQAILSFWAAIASIVFFLSVIANL